MLLYFLLVHLTILTNKIFNTHSQELFLFILHRLCSQEIIWLILNLLQQRITKMEIDRSKIDIQLRIEQLRPLHHKGSEQQSSLLHLPSRLHINGSLFIIFKIIGSYLIYIRTNNRILISYWLITDLILFLTLQDLFLGSLSNFFLLNFACLIVRVILHLRL